MKKTASVLLALALILGLVPAVSMAAYAPEYTAAELRTLGELVFAAPDPGNTSIADQPVRNYWVGWTTDEVHASVNYKYYSAFGDYVVQFYKDNKSTNLTKEQSFFPNAQDSSGFGRLIAPSGGFGTGEDFVLLDFNLKIGDVNTCYQDYYFRDTDGKLILAVRFDINGMYVATSPDNVTEVGPQIEKNVSAVQPFSIAAWNHGQTHSVSLEHDGECIFTKSFDGEINGFGSLDVVIGRYNGNYVHTAIGGLKVTSGVLGDITPERALMALNIPYNIDENYQLPTSIYEMEILWSGDITAKENTVYTTITASIENETKDFDIMIMGKDDRFIAAYTTKGSAALGKSMHLALKTDGGWQPLNFGLGVLFAKANLDDGTVAGTTKVLDKPWLYRKADGKIGVAAQTRTVAGVADVDLTLWETNDLVNFTELGNGTPEGYENNSRISVSGIDGDVSSVLPISEAEADYLSKKLGEVKNTDVDPVSVTTSPGKAITELPALTAYYSDGSTEEIPVEWDKDKLNSIDFSKTGAYTIEGIAAVSDYPSPMISGAADPYVYRYNDKYYFVATNEIGGQVDIYIRGADTIAALASAPPVLIFKHTSGGDNSGCNWAPELHEIGGELYCLFASSTAGSWNAVQSRAMRCSGDPLDPTAWEEPVRITRADGSPLISRGITLDMTYFEANGKHYYCWAERPITSAGNGNSQLVIAEMDPANPYKIVTEPIVICIPSYGWDRNTTTVDEGPYVLKRDGKLYLTFSGSGVDNTYCVGMLTADENADLLVPESWRETGYPVLASEHVSGEQGPGHNAYTKDEYGRDVIVLHMKPGGGTRSCTARTIHYGFDGTPILYMTADRYLKPEYRNVTATVIVADENTSEEDILLSLDAQGLSFFKPEETTADLMLKYEGENGSEITWMSSDPSVISDDGKVMRTDENHSVTMTATLTLGGKTLTKEFEFTVLAVERYTAYLFAYFTGNNVSQERLFYGVSRDGLNFRTLNGGKSILTSDLGTGCIRDPFIFKGEDGYYYIIATDMRSSLGWSSNYAIVVYKTPDLVNIVDKAWINYRNFPSAAECTRAWAPQAIWCPEKDAYMIYLAMSIPGDPYGTVMYRHYATDLCDPSTYTDVELMLDEPAGTNAGAIDGDIIYDKFHNQYIMYYDGKRIATADTLSGEWTHSKTGYADGQLPMETASGATMAVEGSNVWQIIDEDRWIIAADGTSFNGGRYALAETSDFENYTQLWSERGDYSFDFTPRHGYVISISERELNRLFDTYGKVELPTMEEEVKKTYDLSIDVAKKGVDINGDMYGIFFEDINYAVDGGIYSEVVKNRSFEAAHCNPDKNEAYTKIPACGWTVNNASAEYLSEKPLNEYNTTYIRLTTEDGGSISNDCYSGFAVHEDESFDVSLYARGKYDGTVTVSIVDADVVLGSVSFDGISEEFEKYSAVVPTFGTGDAARVRVTLDKAGTIDMDMISVMSRDTYNGRDNGLRKDLVQKLADLHPKFLRFPGGCVVEGYYLDNRYDWKKSIGPVEVRKENWNRWQTGPNAYDYNQTLGLGYYEYFLLCEDIGAKPLPVVNVGLACEYQSKEASTWEELYDKYIPDALDLIEFANGAPDPNWKSLDICAFDHANPATFNNNWANVRALMGHSEPFGLEMIGIGNEQWQLDGNRFFERYEAFEEEIHKFYPDMKLISTAGPSADGTHYDNAWNWFSSHNGEKNFAYVVDEHYYRNPMWFLSNINRYDTYDRNSFPVFAGEYAANGDGYNNTLYAALAEAAFMTGLERNADIVKMASYAPLFAKIGYNQWTPNLIWFNNALAYGSPDYYVQSMYSNNNGSYTLENVIKGDNNQMYVGVGTWNTAAKFRDITITDNDTGETTRIELDDANIIVSASHEPEATNNAQNLIDSSLDTRWSVATYGAYATLDLGKETYVSKVAVNFMVKEGRRYYYTIATSTDGQNFTTVAEEESRVSDGGAHYTDIDAQVRYIRLISGGNSETGNNGWFSPTELTIYGKDGVAIEKRPGNWVKDGDTIAQTDTAIAGAFNLAAVNSENYTFELQAMKTDGAEGFLIPFGYEDDSNYFFWNIGGWNNASHAIQQVNDNVKSTITANVAGHIDSNKWYDVKVVVNDGVAECYLDGELIHTKNVRVTKGPIYSSASYDEESGDIIVKLINTAEQAADVNIHIANAPYINSTATAYVLTGDYMGAVNTEATPENVVTKEIGVNNVSDNFVYEMAAQSFTVLRLHTNKVYAVYADDVNAELMSLPDMVTVHMSDGTVQDFPVEWRIPGGHTYAHEGAYAIEGKIRGTNLHSTAYVTVVKPMASVSIANGKAKFESNVVAKAIVAAYSENGALISVSATEFRGELELELPESADVRAFIWDKNMQPLSKPALKK